MQLHSYEHDPPQVPHTHNIQTHQKAFLIQCPCACVTTCEAPFVLGSRSVQKSPFCAIQYITRSSQRSVSSANARHPCRRCWQVKPVWRQGWEMRRGGVVKPTPNAQQQKMRRRSRHKFQSPFAVPTQYQKMLQ